MKLKFTLFAGVLAASLAVPAFANNAVPSVDALPQFTAADTQMLFEQDAAPMQLAALSPQEMKETEGAWVQFGIGGALGGAGYAWGVYRGNYAWNTSVVLHSYRNLYFHCYSNVVVTKQSGWRV